MISPDAAADAWVAGLGQATQKIKNGIMAVTQSPTSKAAAAIDRQVAGVQRAASSGKTARALNAVSLEEWKRLASEKGVPRIAAGAAAAKGKMASFLRAFLPHVSSGVDQLNASMPRGDLETNLNRMTAMARHNSNFRRQG